MCVILSDMFILLQPQLSFSNVTEVSQHPPNNNNNIIPANYRLIGQGVLVELSKLCPNNATLLLLQRVLAEMT